MGNPTVEDPSKHAAGQSVSKGRTSSVNRTFENVFSVASQRRQNFCGVVYFVDHPQRWDFVLSVVNDIEDKVVQQQRDKAIEHHPCIVHVETGTFAQSP